MRHQYGAFHKALSSLYDENSPSTEPCPSLESRLWLSPTNASRPWLSLSDDERATVPEASASALAAAMDKIAAVIYKDGRFSVAQLRTKEARTLMNETAAILSEGVNTQLPVDVPDTLRYALEENTFTFSGFKTFHAMREIGLSLIADDGHVKPFDQFRDDVKKIHEGYNVNYLRAEYQQAVGASQMAVKWQKIAEDGDRYDLQYRTAQDDKVREDHRLLHGTTLPPSDPFWDKYYPPNGWGCRCTVVQVRHGKYPLSDSQLAITRGDNATAGVKQQMFRFNPGKSMKLFPPKHPYFPKNCDGCNRNGLRLAYNPQSEKCKACGIIAKWQKECLKDKYSKELATWFKENLPAVKVGKFSAKRFEVDVPDGTVFVNKTFYKECIVKHTESEYYPMRLAYARKAHELLAKAKKLYDEESKDHPDATFEVWQYNGDKDFRIEFKVKRNADGRFLHYMRLYKK